MSCRGAQCRCSACRSEVGSSVKHAVRWPPSPPVTLPAAATHPGFLNPAVPPALGYNRHEAAAGWTGPGVPLRCCCLPLQCRRRILQLHRPKEETPVQRRPPAPATPACQSGRATASQDAAGCSIVGPWSMAVPWRSIGVTEVQPSKDISEEVERITAARCGAHTALAGQRQPELENCCSRRRG